MTFNFGNGVYSHSTRPNSHTNISCVRALITGIVNTKVLNEIEQNIFKIYTSLKKDVNATATHITSNSYMTIEKVNICHKIPISAFMKALEGSMNFQLKKTSTSFSAQPWAELVQLYSTVTSATVASPTSDVQAVYNAVMATNQQHQACSAAWQMCLSFDSSDDNLYFGNAMTNSSISDSSDFHYDVSVVSLTDGATPPTPRGPKMQTCLNDLESALGLAPTKQITTTEKNGEEWAMNSGVNGKQSAGTGWVLI